MKRLLVLLAVIMFTCSVQSQNFNPPTSSPTPGDSSLADYFRNETREISAHCLADVQSLADWKSRREQYRRDLQEMLGLSPWPERGDLHATITGKLERDDFTVEKLYFQALPHLYVTANLYLPKKIAKPVPAILYVCGHSKVSKNGVSFGNKTAYQHHGEWFARNGYACLIIDSLQLGEIEGVHHGTHHLGQWWWNSRGYTPAGVEAWFGIRALDYLCSRPEVDKERIGVTGRSGGGSYSWTIAALDDRVKVVAPIAGITDMENQVADGCVDGHCDCMFFLNTHRWDFAQVAALIAPRPLLFGNSDKDRIFPLDGVMRVHEKVRRIYELYGASENFGLLITEGPHHDTQDLQVPVFRWFNRFLKNDTSAIEMAAVKEFAPEELKVFAELPADAVNTNIQSSFVPAAKVLDAGDVKSRRDELIATLKAKTFSGWPSEDLPLEPKLAFSMERDELKFSAWDFTSQNDVRLRLYLVERAGVNSPNVLLTVLNEAGYASWLGGMRSSFEPELAQELSIGEKPLPEGQPLARLRRRMESRDFAQAWIAPRGVGLTAWSGGEKRLTQIRRRFMLLGQTLDGMRVWDIRRAVQLVHFVREGDRARIDLEASEAMAVNARFAALFEPSVRKLQLNVMPESPTDWPDYFNALRYFDAYSAAAQLTTQ